MLYVIHQHCRKVSDGILSRYCFNQHLNVFKVTRQAPGDACLLVVNVARTENCHVAPGLAISLISNNFIDNFFVSLSLLFCCYSDSDFFP